MADSILLSKEMQLPLLFPAHTTVGRTLVTEGTVSFHYGDTPNYFAGWDLAMMVVTVSGLEPFCPPTTASPCALYKGFFFSFQNCIWSSKFHLHVPRFPTCSGNHICPCWLGFCLSDPRHLNHMALNGRKLWFGPGICPNRIPDI